jgi:hypothetical protein
LAAKTSLQVALHQLGFRALGFSLVQEQHLHREAVDEARESNRLEPNVNRGVEHTGVPRNEEFPFEELAALGVARNLNRRQLFIADRSTVERRQHQPGNPRRSGEGDQRLAHGLQACDSTRFQSRCVGVLQQLIDEQVLGIEKQVILAPEIVLQGTRGRAESAGDIAHVHPVQSLLDDGATSGAGYFLFALLALAAHA